MRLIKKQNNIGRPQGSPDNNFSYEEGFYEL